MHTPKNRNSPEPCLEPCLEPCWIGLFKITGFQDLKVSGFQDSIVYPSRFFRVPWFQEFFRGIPARAPAKGFCSGTLEPLTLKALKPWKPATLDSWGFVSFEPWNPATLESCNHRALEPWNFRPFASLEPALNPQA